MNHTIIGKFSHETETTVIEELLDKKRWTDGEFKLLTDFLTHTDQDRQQALTAVPIESLLGPVRHPIPDRQAHASNSLLLVGPRR